MSEASFVDQWIKENEDRQNTPKIQSVEQRIQQEIHSPKNGVKIGASDPGRQRDAWGFVGMQVVPPYMNIIGAQRWLGRAYLSVEQKVALIHFKYHYDFQVIELNNSGLHAYEVLRYVKGLPIIGVTTAKDLRPDKIPKFDPKKFPTIDKNDMVRWMIVEYELGHYLFPKDLTPELRELQKQITGIVESKTASGTIRYAADGTEHDDLFMSLLLDSWLARTKFLGLKHDLYAASGRYSSKYIEGTLTPEQKVEENLKNRWKKERSGFDVTNVSVDFNG